MSNNTSVNIPLNSLSNPPNPTHNLPPPRPQGIQPGSNVAQAAPAAPTAPAVQRRSLETAMVIIEFIISYQNYIWGLAFGIFTIVFAVKNLNMTKKGITVAAQANVYANISLAHSDRAFCVEKKLEHTNGCKHAERYILDHLRLADQVGLKIEGRAIDRYPEQITYSKSEAVDFARNSSYWMQCQLNSFNDFQKHFGKLLAKMDTEAPSSATYVKDFVIQAAAAIQQFGREVEKLGIYRETDSLTEAIGPSEIVRHAIQAMDTTPSFHSMLISHAYQSAYAASEKKLAVRPDCALKPDCKLHGLGALLTKVATGTPDVTSSTHAASYRMNRCPEQCRLALWKSDFLLQKWTDKTRHLLERQPGPTPSSHVQTGQMRLQDIMRGPETKGALLFGLTLSTQICSSFREWILVSSVSTILTLGATRLALSLDPQRMIGGRFVNTFSDILIPHIVLWVNTQGLIKNWSQYERRVLYIYHSIPGALFGGLILLWILRPEMLFGPVVHRPHALTTQLDVRGIATTTLAAFRICEALMLGIFELLEISSLGIVLFAERFTPLKPLQKFYVVMRFGFVLLSAYLLLSSLMLFVSVFYCILFGRVGLAGKYTMWASVAVLSGVSVLMCNMVIQEVALDTISYRGGCREGEAYMEEYKDVVAMLGL